MASKSKSKGNESTGTVLLRQAEPKYKFVGKKLPKQPNESSHRKDKNKDLDSDLTLKGKNPLSESCSSQSTLPKTVSPPPKMLPNQNKLTDINSVTPQTNKPVAVVGASLKSKSKSLSTDTESQEGISGLSSSNSSSSSLSPASPNQRLTSTKPAPESNLSTSLIIQESALTSTPISRTVAQNSSLSPFSSSQNFDDSLADEEGEGTPLIDTSAAAVALSGVTNTMLSRRLLEAESERDKLKKDLDAQLQVNSELKRLLVASVGDDLGKRVERLAQDRVQLSMDIGGFSKKMSEDYENLDKMSIQADMWRSKYLASRVMVEELGNARAYFSLQWHESQDALQQMLNERHELRTNLLEAYKVLQQVKDAFDPLNSHRSSTLTSTNVLDLSRACQQLGEAVRFRLLPAHVATASSVEIDSDSWSDSVTRAEQYAHELLSRPSEPAGSLQSGSSSLLPLTGGSNPNSSTRLCPGSPNNHQHPHPHLNRFHPQVRHENVTYHCCKCTGEISLV